MITVVLLSLILAYLVVKILRGFLDSRKFPPGPYGLPFIGYIPFLGKKPHLKLLEIKNKYGPVFTLRMGPSNVVFLNDWKSVKEVFGGNLALGRPTGMFGGITTAQNLGSASGELWKDQRRHTYRTLHELGFGKQTMENNIKDEIKYFLQEIEANLNRPYDVNEILSSSVSNNICYALFGRRYNYDDPIRIKLNEIYGRAPTVMSAVAGVNFFNFLVKIFLYLNLFQMRETMDRIHFVRKLVDDEVRAHEESLAEDNMRDYIDGYLLERRRRLAESNEGNFTEQVMKENARIFFAAGSETTKTTLSWMLLMTATRPSVQKKVQKEIDEVVGRDRLPTWADRAALPYTQAVINEVQRWASPVPLNLPRRATDDIKVFEHEIPKDTTIIANLWAVSRDESVFENPEEFKPERFLSPDGKQLIKTEALVPFSYGKRACVGETLARFELFFYYTMILQSYDVCLPEGTPITFEYRPGLTLSPLQKSVYIFRKRDP